MVHESREEVLMNNFISRLIPMIPTYIYGAGITAKKVDSYLTKKGIHASAFVVNDKSTQTRTTLDIIDFDELPNEPFNLILGFVPTTNKTSVIKNFILERFSEVNFLSYDFSFLSFGTFPENYLKTEKFKFIKEQLNDQISIDTLIGYLDSRNSGDYTKCQDYFDPNQYFPENIINIKENETFVDCGVFDGETIKEFVKKAKDAFSKVFGFEPDPQNFLTSQKNLEFIPSNKIDLFNIGTWNRKETLRFASTSERISEINPDGEIKINVDSIDNLISNSQEITYIKMDVEGAELNSLKGSSIIICRDKPKLAICLYHKPRDIFEIINYIHSLKLNYKFYIRLHTRYSQELVLYFKDLA